MNRLAPDKDRSLDARRPTVSLHESICSVVAFLRTVLWNATATVRARQGYVLYGIAIDCLEIWTRAY